MGIYRLGVEVYSIFCARHFPVPNQPRIRGKEMTLARHHLL
jgi:hypothetical protein